MPLHTINEVSVFIHELQSVMLISASKEISLSQETIQGIVNEVVADRDKYELLNARDQSKYHIQEPALGFDVFVRQDETLFQYSFTEKGEFISESPSRSLDEAGLFYFQFKNPKGLTDEFQINNANYKINRITAEEFISLPAVEQDKILDEIAIFNKDYFPDHFGLWELNDKSPIVIRDHFRHLQSSLSSLYIIRDNENKMIAINGISATSDGKLTYQSMTITHTEYRNKGFMAVDLLRATFDYPQAVMTAYLVNSAIRNALGVEAISYPNFENILPKERNNYLEKKLSEVTFINNADSARIVQSTIKQQIRDGRELNQPLLNSKENIENNVSLKKS